MGENHVADVNRKRALVDDFVKAMNVGCNGFVQDRDLIQFYCATSDRCASSFDELPEDFKHFRGKTCGEVASFAMDNFSEETISEYLSQLEDTAESMKSLFKTYDRDANGLITREELGQVLGDSFTDKELAYLFGLVDMNHDGKIDYGEFIDWIMKAKLGTKPLIAGWLLQRVSSATPSWQRRWCALYEESLILFEDDSCKLQMDSFELHPQMCAQAAASLQVVHPDTGKRPFTFALNLDPFADAEQEMCIFDAEDAGSLRAWTNMIEEATERLAAAAGVSRGKPAETLERREVCIVGAPLQTETERLEIGRIGWVLYADEDGAVIAFDGTPSPSPILASSYCKLMKEQLMLEKVVYLEVIPLNSTIMHWAIRVGHGLESRCYEFEADGVFWGKKSQLDRGLPITLTELEGKTYKTHEEIQEFVLDFGQTQQYSVAGNGTFGGKNCQDFAEELVDFLGLETGQLPWKQHNLIRAGLGGAATAGLGAGAGLAATAAGVALAPVAAGVGGIFAMGYAAQAAFKMMGKRKHVMRLDIKPYGVLGTALTSKGVKQTGTEPGPREAVLDPTDLDFIQNGPDSCGEASKQTYMWLGILDDKAFPAGVRKAIQAPLQAKLQFYGAKACVHVVGPNFSGQHCSREEALGELTVAYNAILREVAKSSLASLRMQPVSRGLFGGHLAPELPIMTRDALRNAFDKLPEDAQRTVAATRLDMCIFLEDEVTSFRSAFREDLDCVNHPMDGLSRSLRT